METSLKALSSQFGDYRNIYYFFGQKIDNCDLFIFPKVICMHTVY